MARSGSAALPNIKRTERLQGTVVADRGTLHRYLVHIGKKLALCAFYIEHKFYIFGRIHALTAGGH
jgi:hypothetical protein